MAMTFRPPIRLLGIVGACAAVAACSNPPDAASINVTVHRVPFLRRRWTPLFMPVVTTLVAVAIVWRYLYHPRYGLLNYVLGWIGLGPKTAEFERQLARYLGAAHAVGLSSCIAALDLAMVLGTGFAPFRGGPLRTADALGVGRVVREMETLRTTAGERFEPAPMLRALAGEGRAFYAEGSRAAATTS